MKSKFHLTYNEIMQIFKNYTQTPENEYVVKVIDFSEEFEMKGAGYTEDVWGDLDEPVNKTFDRNAKITFIPQDKPYVIVHSRKWPVYYLCCNKNKWYCLETWQYERIEKYITNVRLVTKDGIKPEGVQNGN